MSDFQKDLFAQLKKQKKTKKPPLSEIISELLDVSRNTAYRKIRGEINLSVKEIEIICDTFKTDLNKAVYKDNPFDLYVKRPRAINSLSDLEKYLENMNRQLQELMQKPSTELYYIARDLPQFHAFQQDELGSFKLAIWLRSFKVTDENQGTLPQIPRTIMELAKDLSQVYFSLPTTELWTANTIRSTVDQVMYYHSAGFINKQRAGRILDDLQWVLRSYKRRASRRDASPGLVKGDLYACDFIMMNNGGLAYSKDKKTAFIGLSDIRFVQTDDAAICNQMHQTIKGHLQMGQLISGSAEKEREDFFSKQFMAVEDAVDKLR